MTSSPVSSTWTPPGQTPSSRQAAKKPSISAMTSSKWRVLRPLAVRERVAVHRVAGPHDRVPGVAHRAQERRQQLARRGRRPCARSASAGPATRVRVEPLAQLDAPRRGVAVGPSLTPIGLWTPAKNSTCAPSSWRVRSPIQSMWAEQSYQSPVSESLPRQRLLVAEQQRLVARVEVDLVELRARPARSMPHAAMNRSARSISAASAS